VAFSAIYLPCGAIAGMRATLAGVSVAIVTLRPVISCRYATIAGMSVAIAGLYASISSLRLAIAGLWTAIF
jgi:hypothetical protein